MQFPLRAVSRIVQCRHFKNIATASQSQSFPNLLAPICAIVCALVYLRSAHACSAFEPNDNQHIVFGRNYDWSTPVDNAFEVLDEATIHGSIKWSIVYDETAQQLHFRTMGNSRIRTIDLAALDFTCAKTMKMLDMNAAGGGNVTKLLRDYSTGMDRSLIE